LEPEIVGSGYVEPIANAMAAAKCVLEFAIGKISVQTSDCHQGRQRNLQISNMRTKTIRLCHA